MQTPNNKNNNEASVHYRDTDIRFCKSRVIPIAWVAPKICNLNERLCDNAKDGLAGRENGHTIRHSIYESQTFKL